MASDKHRYGVTTAEPQPQHNSEVVAIRNLIHDRPLYDNYPKIQRGYVWPQKFKRALIDSILRGYPIHPLLAYKAVSEDGKEQFWILDGHQRLSTIYEFATGRFALPTIAEAKRDEPRSLPPIEPGKRFNELSERARNIFLSYKFVVNLMQDTDEAAMGLIFRRVQHQLPLSMAEKLASYASVAKDYAVRLQDNPIWSDFYIGPVARKETLQGSLSLLLLELMQDYTVLDGKRLHDFAAGIKDKLLTPALYDAVIARLDVVMHVFAETTFTHRAELIPMYQAIMLLEKQGRTFTSSDKGCLTPWFGGVLNEAEEAGRNGFSYALARMVEVNKQHDFWEIHLPIIAEQCQSKTGSAA